MRLESNKPTQLPIDSTFHFGASTRYYIIRERPQTGNRTIIDELEKSSEDAEAGGLLGLPETETELDVNISYFESRVFGDLKILFSRISRNSIRRIIDEFQCWALPMTRCINRRGNERKREFHLMTTRK